MRTMTEPSRLLLELARTVDELLQAAAQTSSDLRRRAESGVGPNAPAQLAELLARTLDRVEGPALASLRSGLRAEQRRWAERAARDPSAARVRDVIATLLTVLEPDPDGSCDASGGRTP